MKTNTKSKIQVPTVKLIVLASLACGLYGYADIAPSYHSSYEPTTDRQNLSPAVPVEFEYGISDTTIGYLIPGIEVKVSRFRRNGEDIYGGYDSFRKVVKPVAAGLYRYGLLIVLALFVIVWLAVAASKWQRPVHITARRHTVEQQHLAYLMHRRQMGRNAPNYDPLTRSTPERKSK
jgi:hypothetical protein